jgi:hypothetical protein
VDKTIHLTLINLTSSRNTFTPGPWFMRNWCGFYSCAVSKKSWNICLKWILCTILYLMCFLLCTLCSIRWINWNLKLKLRTKYLCCWHFHFLYTLNREDKKTFFFLLIFFFLSSLFKVYKKVVEFSFTPTKNILVF